MGKTKKMKKLIKAAKMGKPRAIYHDQGEYCDRTWAVLREPSETPFILEIGKDAQTHVSCFCKLEGRPDLQSE